MADSAAELQRLLDRRDLAAYRAVAAIAVVLDFWEAQDYASALDQLQRARAEFQDADHRVHQFHKFTQGEFHGHRLTI